MVTYNNKKQKCMPVHTFMQSVFVWTCLLFLTYFLISFTVDVGLEGYVEGKKINTVFNMCYNYLQRQSP